jgi:hypothetical protein
LPVDHAKSVASIKLPPKNVVVLALDLVTNPIPTAVDLSHVFNVSAVRHDGTPATNGGIGGAGDAISFENIGNSTVVADSPFPLPVPNTLDAVKGTTVPLPSGAFDTLKLFGMGVNGNHPNAVVVINYQDGTSATLKQGFSDWHTPQSYAGESNAVGMTYRLAADGSHHPGAYVVYEYALSLDPTKKVASIELPATGVIILSMLLVP